MKRRQFLKLIGLSAVIPTLPVIAKAKPDFVLTEKMIVEAHNSMPKYAANIRSDCEWWEEDIVTKLSKRIHVQLDNDSKNKTLKITEKEYTDLMKIMMQREPKVPAGTGFCEKEYCVYFNDFKLEVI